MEITQHGLHYSVIEHLRKKHGLPVLWVFDGYKKPETKPYMTVEQMPNNFRILAKQRESVEAIYRFQIGLFAGSSSQRAQIQAQIERTFMFDTFTYLDTATQPATAGGSFLCELTGVVPMFAEAVTNQSDYHRVYFDVEITDIKRRR